MGLANNLLSLHLRNNVTQGTIITIKLKIIMKKFTFAIMALAAMTLASCGNSTKSGDAADSTAVDTTSFEQSQLKASVKMHLDSLATLVNEKQFDAIDDNIKAGKIKLTDEDKKVKPNYLLSPEAAANLTSMGQKYAAYAMLAADREVANAYGMDVKGYDETLSKLAADINDPAMKKASEATGKQAQAEALYKAMEAEGRINFYWIMSSAATLETVYVMAQNLDKFCVGYTDDQIANITFRMVCVIDALDNLSAYDPQVMGVSEALTPLKTLNAITVDQFKKQLNDAKEQIAASRAAFLK